MSTLNSHSGGNDRDLGKLLKGLAITGLFALGIGVAGLKSYQDIKERRVDDKIIRTHNYGTYTVTTYGGDNFEFYAEQDRAEHPYLSEVSTSRLVEEYQKVNNGQDRPVPRQPVKRINWQ